MLSPMFRFSTSFWLILITGLGFFVDSYDAFSYNVMRVPSLTELGLSGDALTRAGMTILNWQVFGIMLGGFAWGLLGNFVGRKRALLGSILVYSVAMLANAFVHDVTTYTILRFLVGFGVAGEVGLAAALVGETLPTRTRTYGLAFMTVLGLLGVTAAALSVELFHWRVMCAIGGASGLLLLFLRGLLLESPLFAQPDTGRFLAPLKTVIMSRTYLLRYLACAALLAPNFMITGVILTLSPEIGNSLHLAAPVKANIVIGGYFIVAAFGDMLGAALTQHWRSRRRAIMWFMIGNLACVLIYLHALSGVGTWTFYLAGSLIGLFNVWALSATVAVEQFPTPLRATVTTSALTFGRSMIMVFNMILLTLKPHLGLLNGLTVIAVVALGIGLLVAWRMRETYDADLSAIPS